FVLFFFSSRRRHTRCLSDWSSDVCSSDLIALYVPASGEPAFIVPTINAEHARENPGGVSNVIAWPDEEGWQSRMASLLERAKLRSEERRVGKEWRYGGWRGHREYVEDRLD